MAGKYLYAAFAFYYWLTSAKITYAKRLEVLFYILQKRAKGYHGIGYHFIRHDAYGYTIS